MGQTTATIMGDEKMRPVLGIFSVFPELKHVWKGCFGQGTIKMPAR